MRFVKNKGNFISSKHRGDQIAECLGADFMENEMKETLIFLKGYDDDTAKKYKNVYIDMMDSSLFLYQQDKIAPHVKFIVSSDVAKNYVKWRTEREIVVVPDSHLNFENYVRPVPKRIKAVGYVGNINRFDADIEDVTKKFEDAGFTFKTMLMENAYYTREQICEFHKGLDLNIAFQKPRNAHYMPPELKTHPKIVHAASFGIPTIAYPEVGFMRARGWIPIHSVSEMVHSVVDLNADMLRYKVLRELGLVYAKSFHVKVIAEMYKTL